MRTQFTNIVLFITINMLLASCGSNKSVVSFNKRHYMNGNYVNHPGKAPKTTDYEAPSSAYNNNDGSVFASGETEGVTEDLDASIITENKYDVKNLTQEDYFLQKNEGKKIRKNDKDNYKGKLSNSLAPAKMIIKHPRKIKSILNQVKQNADEGDGLSLFWIVVLVLIILWALGLIGGGWGLGFLIHILLILAIIAAILWLLRVI